MSEMRSVVVLNRSRKALACFFTSAVTDAIEPEVSITNAMSRSFRMVWEEALMSSRLKPITPMNMTGMLERAETSTVMLPGCGLSKPTLVSCVTWDEPR